MKYRTYRYLATVALFVGDKQLAAMLCRCAIEGNLKLAVGNSMAYYHALQKLKSEGLLSTEGKQELKRAYSKCSGCIHGGDISSRTLRKAIVAAGLLQRHLRTVKGQARPKVNRIDSK